VPTLLHVSDIHRTTGPRLRNETLLAAMASDSRRWESDGIPPPDVIVVSGDLIHGADPHTENADSEICAQYNEASEFLAALTDEFADSDRSRVIVVPGNHDVHWGRARGAMQSMPNCPGQIARNALEPDSGFRWDWDSQQALQIIDDELYDSRFEHFRLFRTEFYAGLTTCPLIQDDNDLIFAEYPSLGLVVVGFASWYGNDCFCHIGDIDPSALARSQKLLADSRLPVAVAVWHHSVVGGPRDQDYMDQRIVHRLIDFGFNVGLHGHQHHAGATPHELRFPDLSSMVVVGAGSLAVGDNQLPAGECRQFNLIVIDAESETITVHVRGMTSGGVFTSLNRPDFSGNTSLSLKLPTSPLRSEGPVENRLLDDAITAVRRQQFDKAWEFLEPVRESLQSYPGRQVLIETLDGLRYYDELLEVLGEPQNADEVAKAISVLLSMRDFSRASAYLDVTRPLLDDATFRQISERIAVERMLP